MVPILLTMMSVTMAFLVPFIIWDASLSTNDSNIAINAAFAFAFIGAICLSVYAGKNFHRNFIEFSEKFSLTKNH